MHASRSCTQERTVLNLLNYYTLIMLATLHCNDHKALSSAPLIHTREVSGSNPGLKTEHFK